MECKRTDLKKDKKGNYTHKPCSKQSTSNAHCRDCCDCKHPEDRSRKRVTCKNKCDKKHKNYAPEPSSQYELDSFEIGTESAVCEDCGEIHGLDEYEEVDKIKRKSKSGEQIYGDIIHFDNIGGDGKKTVDFDKCNKCQKKRVGKSACLKKYCPGGSKFTSEPIPDYIMRALQPKKSVHSVYGKLRY